MPNKVGHRPNNQLTYKMIEAAIYQSRGILTVVCKRLGAAMGKKKPANLKNLYQWFSRHPELKELINAERDKAVDISEVKLLQAVKNGEPWAIKYHLDHQGGARGYGSKLMIDMMSGGEKITAPAITVNIIHSVLEQKEEAEDGNKSD